MTKEVRRVIINGFAHDSRYDAPRRIGPVARYWLTILAGALLCTIFAHMAFGADKPLEWATYPPPDGTVPWATVTVHNGGDLFPEKWTMTWPGGSAEKPVAQPHRRIAVGMQCDWYDVDATDRTKILIRCMRTADATTFGPPAGICPPDFSPSPKREPWPSCKLWKGTGQWND